jgi:cytochrome c peroxidase
MKLATKSAIISALALLAGAMSAQAQRGGGGAAPIRSLKTIAVPAPANLSNYVRDNNALVILGKALFWDTQAGGDGRTACATCHFHAGADHRLPNQLTSVTPNGTLAAADFPFHKLSDPTNNRSAVLSDKRQVAGSAGVIHRTFFDVNPGSVVDDGADVAGETTAAIAGIRTRQVTARNAPSVINAAFNVRNFWDGRAAGVFSGSTPFGGSDPNSNALAYRNGQLQREQLRITNSSLASQAVGPALNAAEMSYDGRPWPKLGRKLLALQPLARQQVRIDDSVLSAFANPVGNGLSTSYAALIQAAFQPEYWTAPDTTDGYSQMEMNFALYWGLAIQAYESTLISNDSRLDQFLEGNRNALTALEQQGFNGFQQGNAQCTQCHQGTEFTAASYTNVLRRGANPANPDDAGFFRTGVTLIAEDIGLGAKDGFNIPLFTPARAGQADGTFKAPGLRNAEFTGPYFHDGGQATLEQVLAFYGRNGDFPAGGNLGPGIGRIRLSAADQTALVAFLKALSDDRVRFERAPFDHPSLCVPNGHAESAPGVPEIDSSDARFKLTALDKFALIPASGKFGNSVPLQTFDELLRGVGSDGSRAHAMAESCTP